MAEHDALKAKADPPRRRLARACPGPRPQARSFTSGVGVVEYIGRVMSREPLRALVVSLSVVIAPADRPSPLVS